MLIAMKTIFLIFSLTAIFSISAQGIPIKNSQLRGFTRENSLVQKLIGLRPLAFPSLIKKGPEGGHLLSLGKPINILVWNVYKSQKKKFLKEWNNILSVIDIALIQEFITKIENFSVHSEFHSYFTPAFQIDQKYFSGTAIFSKTRPNRVKSLLSTDNEPLVQTPKSTQIAWYSITGGESLLVVNIHALNFVRELDFEKQIKDFYDEIKEYNGPLLVAGDFNTWSKERKDIVLKYTNRLKLKEVPFTPGERTMTLGNPLDLVFYRKLKVLKHQVLTPLSGSDHRALFIKIII
jgi:endonuclease/exonuclease/phosphatase (EEP) superfamily protein YafD